MPTTTRRADRHYAASDTDHTARRQPRPTPRRQGTRSAVIRTAMREQS